MKINPQVIGGIVGFLISVMILSLDIYPESLRGLNGLLIIAGSVFIIGMMQFGIWIGRFFK